MTRRGGRGSRRKEKTGRFASAAAAALAARMRTADAVSPRSACKHPEQHRTHLFRSYTPCVSRSLRSRFFFSRTLFLPRERRDPFFFSSRPRVSPDTYVCRSSSRAPSGPSHTHPFAGRRTNGRRATEWVLLKRRARQTTARSHVSRGVRRVMQVSDTLTADAR